jgi:uncharacterized NAD-dependent epimerase/dehydratase family protein
MGPQMAALLAPTKGVAVALDAQLYPDDDDARRLCQQIEAETGLPTDDVVRLGPDRLWAAITAVLGG